VNYKTIKNLFFAERYKECLNICKKLLKSEPENALAWKYAGKSLFALADYVKAKECQARAHQLNRDDPEIIKDMGDILNALNEKEAASQCYEQAIKTSKDYAPAIFKLAVLKKTLGNLEDALYLFKRCLEVDKQLTLAYVGAAECFLTLGDFTQAESFAIEALKLNRIAPAANEILGIIYQNNNNLKKPLSITRGN